MYPSTNSLIPLAAFFVLIVFLFAGLTLNPQQIPSPLIDQKAPKFQLPKLEDPKQTIGTQDFAGQVVLFNVWATWCVSCRQEHPILMQLAKFQIPIYGLNYKDDRTSAIALLQQHGNPYTASAFDAEGRVGIEWGVYGTPETFIIDRQGRIRYKHVGPITANVAEDVILPWVQNLRAESDSIKP